MLQEFKQLRSTPQEWRRFGWLMALILAALGLGLAWRGSSAAWLGLAAAGLALGLLGRFSPALLRWPYLLWMGIGLVLGTIVSSLFLTLFFYLVLTPLGLLARAMGKDFLERRRHPQAGSYWKRRPDTCPPKPERYENQF